MEDNGLEDEFAGNLQLTCRKGRRDVAKSAVAAIVIRSPVVYVVQRVEGFAA